MPPSQLLTTLISIIIVIHTTLNKGLLVLLQVFWSVTNNDLKIITK